MTKFVYLTFSLLKVEGQQIKGERKIIIGMEMCAYIYIYIYAHTQTHNQFHNLFKDSRLVMSKSREK